MIGSAAFAGLTVVTDRQTLLEDDATPSVAIGRIFIVFKMSTFYVLITLSKCEIMRNFFYVDRLAYRIAHLTCKL